MGEFIEVPITVGFQNEEIVGTLKVLKSALPPTVDWCFSLGYIVDDAEFHPDTEEFIVTKYTLKTVAILPDALYPGGKG